MVRDYLDHSIFSVDDFVVRKREGAFKVNVLQALTNYEI